MKSINNEDIIAALEVLKAGGIILYPTDTIWGIGCDACNPEAVKRIYELKERADSKSMLVLVNSTNMLERYIADIPEVCFDIIDVTDKPLTIIYSGAKNIADNLISNDGSIGIRVTDEEFSNRLVSRFRRPIVSTSANISGKSSPRNFMEIDQEIISKVDYVVKYKNDDSSFGQVSGIIKLGEDGQVKVLRD